MANKNFSTLVHKVLPFVPQCPIPVATNYIRDAAIKTCSDTHAWRYMIPLFDLLPGVHEYAFNVPTSSEVVGIFAAHMNNEPLHRFTLDQALYHHPEWADLFSGEDASEVWSETPSMAYDGTVYNDELFNGSSSFVLPDSIVADASRPDCVVALTPQRFIVLPLPDGDDTYAMRMFVALKPTRTATYMDEEAMNNMEEAIVEKALEDLLLLPNELWHDVNLARIHAQRAKNAAFEAKANANLGNVRGSLGVHIRSFT